MPRIPRQDHAAIRHRVDVAGQKVAEVAAAYGCTPANIYAILARLRRQGGAAPASAAPPAETLQAGMGPGPDAATADLFLGLAAAPAQDPAPQAVTAPGPAMAVPESPAAPPEAPPAPRPSPVPALPARAAPPARVASPAPGPRSGKAGYALLMRSGDGEEAVHPFRSLDELLSAARPLLRMAARSPEPIWFSLQQVDLETLEDSV